MSHQIRDEVMNTFPRKLTTLGTELWHIVIIPIFFLVFAALYRPVGLDALLGMDRGLYSFNVTILSAIILGCLAITRFIHYFLRNVLYKNWWTYILWCLMELLVMSLFCALYITLMLNDGSSFFEQVRNSLMWLAVILIFPYTVLTLVFINISLLERSPGTPDDDSLVRFYDHNHQLKFVVAESALLYVAAEENYVRIYYLDNAQVKDYQLRSSMTAIEPVMTKAGLFRCQRSYYINPSHIKALRKDQGSSVSAELDTSGISIPVSRKFYDALSELI